MDELTSGLHAARYMLLMMGCFAVYAGFIYNDTFSLGLDLFGTRWKWPSGVEDGDEAVLNCEGELGNSDCVYPFGVDPFWHIAENELAFFNSLKMKMSVIIGVMQVS